MKNTFYMTDPRFDVGDEIIVIEETNIKTGEIRYRAELLADCPTGIPGNHRPDNTSFHGWRGTTNDISVYPLGVRRVKSMDYRDDKSYNGADGEHHEVYNVVCTPDLHPDWE